ncbi:MAG TPA: right-handed parallel beta-helix repeat-containing protein [Thermoanaerobaculia bacterium]|nr:right-handed parallel beta-helix repeat-containing protein [Thermoanaerobaculia bacterium]
MRVTGWSRSILILALLLMATSMFAQATRTWVSGVGDDVNPCSRTAPCKTYAGAISKTASGGIIDALDPGGYGTLTITKPITVEGTGTLASTLNSSVNGFVINIAAGPTNRHVVLRNLSVDGAGTTLGVDGVRFVSGDSLILENVDIKTQSSDGIEFLPNSLARLVVNNCRISNASGNGILIKPVVGGTARVSIHNSTIAKNGTGVRAEPDSNVSIVRSSIVNNTVDGVFATAAGGAGATVLVEDSEISHNAGIGLRTSGGTAVLRVANSLISGNGTGTSNAGLELCSFGNNRISGNSNNGPLPLPACNPGNN